MARPLVYLDECVVLSLMSRLRGRGFMVSSAHRTVMSGEDDHAQLVHATTIGAVIVSHDSEDFRRLHRRVQPHGGIITLPRSPIDLLEIRAAMLLDWLATVDDYRSQLFRWHELQQLLIRGFRLDGYSEDEVRRALGQQ